MDQKHRTTAADIGLFLLRLHAGFSICAGGWNKFPATGWFVEQVGGLGWPLPTFFANCAGAAEFIGGALLVLGLLTRPAAVFLTITMAVATFQLQEIRALSTINAAHLYFWVFLMFVFTGAGGWSLDRLFSRSNEETQKPIWMRRLLAAIAIGGTMYCRIRCSDANRIQVRCERLMGHERRRAGRAIATVSGIWSHRNDGFRRKYFNIHSGCGEIPF